MVASGYHGAARKSIIGRLRAGVPKSVCQGTRQVSPFAIKIPAMYRGAPAFGHIREFWMSIDLGAVRRIAQLARIEVTEAETPHLQGEINAILKFVEALDAVDVDGVEPMTSVIPMRLPMREDVVTDGGIAPLVLANAPMTEDGFFVVPKVIE
jgi:aspartyl-tRNA(Asn)/glutamyl-tRNA(Gln) amidotransferase subunit C